MFSEKQATLTGFPFEEDIGGKRTSFVEEEDAELRVIEDNVSFARQVWPITFPAAAAN